MNRAHTLIPRGLIVSCQAEEGSPFNAPEFIAAFAKAAELGGAVALRIRDVENIKAVKRITTVPIIGITKSFFDSGEILITGTFEEIEQVIAAGADIVALDVTNRPRPSGMDGLKFLRAARKRFNIPMMADVATEDEGIAAADAGAELVGTTLSGYTSYTTKMRNDVPDFELIERLSAKLPGQVIAEGRVWTPEQAALSLKLGAYAVVVGTAITRPAAVVKRFAEAVRKNF
jgi:N-acylglucosamine-6-phosphate 2-epimerase